MSSFYHGVPTQLNGSTLSPLFLLETSTCEANQGDIIMLSNLNHQAATADANQLDTAESSATPNRHPIRRWLRRWLRLGLIGLLVLLTILVVNTLLTNPVMAPIIDE